MLHLINFHKKEEILNCCKVKYSKNFKTTVNTLDMNTNRHSAQPYNTDKAHHFGQTAGDNERMRFPITSAEIRRQSQLANFARCFLSSFHIFSKGSAAASNGNRRYFRLAEASMNSEWYSFRCFKMLHLLITGVLLFLALLFVLKMIPIFEFGSLPSSSYYERKWKRIIPCN